MSEFGSNNPTIVVSRKIGGDRVERRYSAIRRTVTFDVYPNQNDAAANRILTPDLAIDAFVVNPGLAGEAPLVIGTPHPSAPGLEATEFTIRENPNARGAWIVEWTFSTPDGGGIIDPPQTGFKEINVDNEVEFQDFFRQNAAVPPQGNAPLPIEPITDGEDIAVDGRPTSLPVRTIRADVSIIIDFTPQFSLYAFVTGTRNNAPFLGGVTGSILYTGARSNRISENQWRVTHSFVQDQFFHCRQIGKFDDTGNLVESYWVQPFRSLGNFSVLGLDPL